jgi:transposase InsO family protein
MPRLARTHLAQLLPDTRSRLGTGGASKAFPGRPEKWSQPDLGGLALAAVQDAYSHRIVGWAMTEHMRTELVADALQMAVHRRRPEPGLVHHSDQGPLNISHRLRPAGRST